MTYVHILILTLFFVSPSIYADKEIHKSKKQLINTLAQVTHDSDNVTDTSDRGTTNKITTNLNENITDNASYNVSNSDETNTTSKTTRAPFTARINAGSTSATPDTLSFETNGNERMYIDGSGNVTIDGLANLGVIHTDINGTLTTSLIVNADITDATISNAKLAAIASTNTPDAIVLRDVSGNFSAGTITADLIGNVIGSTTDFTGSLTGDVTGTQNATVVSFVGGQSAATVAAATVTVNAATNLGTPGTLVERDGFGDFSANTITANLIGNATTATTATNSTNFSGILTGDVTGTQNATVVSLVGGQSATNVASATVLANSATSVNTLNSIVKRDGSGDFSAGTITANLIGNVTGNVSGSATDFTGSLVGDVTGVQSATIVSAVGGATASDIAAATATVDAATNLNIPSTLVERDASGNFSAGTITADLTGNISGSATNFTGSLTGDVTGTQNATVVSLVGGQTAANVASATILANSATSANTLDSIVKRDGSGDFSAGTITANVIGNVTGNVSGSAASFTGSLIGDVTGTQGATVVDTVGGATATDIAAATSLVTTATSTNIPNTLVERDGSGNFAASMITANLTGNVTGNVSGSAASFTGSLLGDVTGTQGATIVSTVGGATALNVATATATVDAATNLNTPNTLVERDGSGNFSAGTITANIIGDVTGDLTGNISGSAANFTGSLTGDVTGTQNATVVSLVGGATALDVATATATVDAATNLNTPNTLVERDSSGDFSAGTITANLIGNVTGSSSLNVLKAGDSMTGSLNMLAQNEIRFQDVTGGQYVGLNAPSIIPTSYTLSLPTTAPTAHQFLQSNSTTPTNLEWITTSGSITPAYSKTVYVAKYGNDITGDGSLNTPYATLSKAINTANSIASSVNPIAIVINPGIYVENNSAGPLTVTANGISIVGDSALSVFIMPSNPANDLLLINQTIRIADITLQSASPLATGMSLTSGNFSGFSNLRINNFLTGVSCSGGATSTFGFNKCAFALNGTALLVNNTIVECDACDIFGKNSLASPPGNTGVTITGASASVVITGGVCGLCQTAYTVTNNARLAASAIVFRRNIFDIVQTTASRMTLNACDFELTGTSSDIDIKISDPGTNAEIISCSFNGKDIGGTPQGTCLEITNSALVTISGGSMQHYTNAIHLGSSTDTSATSLSASALLIQNCTTDILQEGSSTLTINASTASNSKIIINDPTNISLAFFDLETNNSLMIGSNADIDTSLLHAAIGSIDRIGIHYESSLYNTQAIGVNNHSANPTSLFALSNNNTDLTAIITDRTKTAGVRLVSDEGSPVGGTSALRGWDLKKTGTTAELLFNYQNTDVFGQSVIPEYTVMQLDGVNNQVQLPTTATQIVFASDTNLYRSAANVLKTDDNFIIGTLTPNRAVITNASNQLASSIITDTELSNLSGTTSAIQTQLNNKVAKAGDTMTGTLQLPAGTTAAPSLTFTGSTTTGLSTNSNNLSLSTNGTERMKVSSGGVVSINGFNTTGIVHNDSFGNLSTSLIVDTDISPLAAITDSKLASITTPGKVVNSATSATSANIASAIVSRDASGNFAANTITANLTGNVTGSASNNVLKAGDSMTGILNMLTQNAVRFQDLTGGEYVGINAPSTIATSYTLSLPSTIPTANQTLRANSTTPTNLEWITEGGSNPPATSKTIYVTKYGNDITGDGSFVTPYATLAKAVTTANSISSGANPVAIIISSGTYVENNSAGPITVTANGISIIGDSASSLFIIPNTPTNTLLLSNTTLRVANITFQSAAPLATGISLTAGSFSNLTNVRLFNFQTGVICAGSTSTYLLDNCLFIINGTALSVNDTTLQCNNCTISGAASIAAPAANTGVSVTGSNTTFVLSGGTCIFCTTGININGNARTTLNAAGFKRNTFDILQTGASSMTLSGCSFERTNGVADIDIQISGAGTTAEIISCEFSGTSTFGTIQAAGVLVSDNAFVNISGGSMQNYTAGIQVGTPSDSASTELSISAFVIRDCGTDIIQEGSTTLNINGCTASSSKININDPTNVTLAFFDLDNNNALEIGPTTDIDITLLQAAISTTNNPGIDYLSSLYSTQAIGYNNPTSNPSSLFSLGNNNTNLTGITTDRTKTACVRLVSDEGSPVGGTSALRGWDIIKTGTSAELSFNYQNTDVFGQSVIPQYTVMQLDGVNNQMQLSTAGTQIVFAGDTNLYRSAANVLKTDDNLIVNPLTPNRVVTTDSVSNQLASSIVTNTELGFLSGTTSAIQTQLNSKVAKAGDIMTGALQLPAGTTAAPSLTFTGSTTTGLSTNSNNLSFSTNGTERMKVSSGGVVSINGFNTTGVVHNDSFGNLSTSLITNTDIIANAGIIDSKLANITTAGKVANSATTATSANTASTIVARDASGNFAAGTITANLIGNVTGNASGNVLKSGDTMTGALTVPAGSAASPSIKFSGSTNTGISAATANTLSFDTNGIERIHINATGGVTVDDLASIGVVHTNNTGLLSTSLVVDADITNATISNAKLATIASANTSDAIVVRDGSGNFSTNQITILGPVFNNTDAATKAYVDTAISTGLVAKIPAVVVSISNVTLSGTQTIDGVALNVNDRVLLVGQTNPIENGLWEVQAGAWTRPADFASGTTAGQAYVLITSGAVYTGSSWLCNTPLSIIDTDPIMFAQFSLPDQTTGANVGTGVGQVFRNKTSTILNFRTLAEGQHIDITNNADDITFATDATDVNTASTIVARDASGNFAATTITADLMGSASDNVLKAGDSMTGTLNMLAENEVRFQDAAGGQYVGLNAPSTVPTSYTLSLPSDAPATSQTLRAGNFTAGQLEWVTEGGSITPDISRVIYVTKYGNDTDGDGSFDLPYASLGKAVDLANSLASVSDQITILVAAGTYIEDNSAAPLTITSEGISIIGDSQSAVIFIPNNPMNDFLVVNQTVYISNATLMSLAPMATGISLTAGTFSVINGLKIINFATGIACAGTASSYLCESCVFINNGTGLFINNTVVECITCTLLGSASLYSNPANTGLSIVGPTSVCAMTGGSVALCSIGLNVGNNSLLTTSAAVFKLNTFDVIQTGASHMTLSACTFAITTTSADVDIQISGPGTYAEIIGCQFNGKDVVSTSGATALHISDGATLDINGGGMKNYTTALHIGTPTDTSSTRLTASAFIIQDCVTDILQEGSATLNLNASTASSSKIIINDPTNVNLAYFDLENNNSLMVGPNADVDLSLLQAAISTTNNPGLDYRSSLYSTQAIGLYNPLSSPSTLFAQSNDNTNLTAITTDRTKMSKINLFSDEGSPVGSTSALRGWNMQKNASTAELAFNYQNSDIIGQSAIPEYTIMQLDGVTNQVQLPTTGTQIVFATDTNLYRSAANVLKTDDNFIVGTLTPNRAIITNASNQLASSITNDTEISYLSGTTSAVQTQLNSKVAKAGDIMTGALQLPAGTTAAPSLTFTGSTITGLSASSNTLSFSTNGAESMKISSGGIVSINEFTTAGVVHNDGSGNLSTSLITNSDIIANAGIVDSKLANITTPGKVTNSATTATSANTPNAIVSRDVSGNFTANTITANLIGNVTGNASGNVLKTGDSMTGALNMLTQNEVRFQDTTGGQYVGINAPSIITSSYTISLPTDAPIANQTLRANSITPTELEWISEGGAIAPAVGRVVYVTQYGSDISGDGSFDLPYASLSKALDLANSLASVSAPITIFLSAGTYIEDNSAGPLAVNVEGISIVGDSPSAVIFIPNTPTNNFLVVNQTAYIGNATFMSFAPMATGILLTNGTLSILNNLKIVNFATGIECAGTASSYLCESCLFADNGTGLFINDTVVEVNTCTIIGADSLYGAAANTGISIIGSTSVCAMTGGSCVLCEIGLDVGNNSLLTASAAVFKLNTFDVIQTAASHMTLSACTFAITTTSSDIDIQISGAGTYAEIIGCQFNGKDVVSTPGATALHISDGATLDINGGGMKNYTTALHVGTPTDTSATQLSVSAFNIHDCTIDILQEGSATLNLNASTASSSKISINDSTNVKLAYFNFENNNSLMVGSTADEDINLIQAAIGTPASPGLDYRSSLYATQAIGYYNPLNNPSTFFAQSNDNTNLTAITTDRTKATGINLLSDEGSPVGNTSTLRGWNVQKNATTAELSFNYQNSDLTGQSAIPEYTVMQLDGVNNQVQLSTVGTHIVFSGDTNLYRSAANVLKTDDNFIVGTLTPNRVIITNASNQLASSITNDTELGYLSGTTSAVQTQLNSKVAKAGDIMTGTLQLPAGTTAAPSLTFTGSPTTGLSASSNNLSFSTNGIENMKISSSGIVSINGFSTPGIVHNDASGNLSTSLITNNDIIANAGISDSKLANITTAGKVANSATTATSANNVNTIVLRDSSGNFSAGTITAALSGNATTATTATNFSGSLVGDVTGTQGATVVGLVGGQTAANVAAATVLANAATNLNTANTIVKRDVSGNFSAGTITANLLGNVTGNVTGSASNNVLKAGDTMTGTLQLPAGTTALPSLVFTGNTTTGLSSSATNILSFSTNALERMRISAGGVVSINAFTSAGLVHNDTSGNLSSSLLVNADITPATITNASLATISSANTAGNIVVRDGSGNFSAGTITAALNGNATTATTAGSFSGSLVGDVTGTQGATVVSLVGGQTATNVAAATVLTNAATNLNTPNAIVKRDASGNFSATTITANLTGLASLNLPLSGGTLTGSLTLPAGTPAAPSLQFTGSTNTGLSAATANTLSFDTNGVERMNINPTGAITINGLNSTGVVHTSAAGLLSTSLIVNADITPATITNASLATISSANTAGNIVVRDGSGNFAAGTITAALNGNATTATTATNFSGSLVGDVTGTQGATVVSLVGGQTAATVAATTSLVSTATSANIANTIVKRDASGNFAAGNITANLTGNLTGNVTGNVTGSASNNVLKAGDIMTGTLQLPAGTTALPSLVFTGNTTTGLSSSATNILSFSTNALERMRISAGGVVSINAFTSAGLVHNDTSGNLSSSLLVNADITPATITNASLATISSANTAGNIVVRDGSGNFSAGTITAALNGNATTATTAGSFSGSLVGDVTGTQGATVVSLVGGQTATNVAAATVLANAATNLNTANAIVKRDASGNFSAGTITANLIGNVTGSASLNVLKSGDTMTGTLTHPAGTPAAPSIQFTGSTNTGISAAVANTLSFDTNGAERMNINATGGVTINGLNNTGVVHTNAVGLLSTSLIVNADITPATITNASLATISSANTAGNIVVRDGSGNFSAGTITAALNGNATTATTATSFSGSLVGDVTGTQAATVVSLVGGQTATNVAAATVLANAATDANAANTIVKRDALGNFSAGTITAALNGNATTATTATNFSGSLVGDITGTQGATVVSLVGGQTSTNVAAATILANAATDANTANTIVKRDALGNFSAGTITANLSGNATTATSTANFSGPLVGDVTGTQGATVVSLVGGQTATNVALATVLANAATNLNTANAIVKRDASGNFSAGTITAALNGNATTATTATNFSGPLVGDVTGTQGATVVSLIGGQTAANVAAAAILANAATNLNTASTIVRRDASGNFAASTVTLSGNLTLSTEPSTSTSGNIVKGSSRFIHDFGTNNTFMGINAGNFTTSGSGGNSAFGTSALTANGTGAFNTAIGTSALVANTTGNDNTAIGYNALLTNSAGTDCTAVGYRALTLSTGNFNTAIGSNAMAALTIATANTVLGYNSLSACTSGGSNIAIGSNSGGTLTTGSGNIYINANAASAAETNTVRIGTSQTSCFIQGINGTFQSGASLPVFVNASGQLGISSVAVPFVNQAIQVVDPFTTGNTATALAGTSVLILNAANTVNGCTIVFPPSPLNGQYFTILLAQTQSVNSITNNGNGATVVNAITGLTNGAPLASTGGTTVTYIYYAATNTWYRSGR